MGQASTKVGEEFVEEAQLKLVPIGSGVVAAFAGDVGTASRCLDYLRDHLELFETLSPLLRSLHTSLGPFTEDQRVHLLIARSFKAAPPQFLHWSTDAGETPGEPAFACIGRLEQSQEDGIFKLLQAIVRSRFDEDMALPAAVAVANSYGVHYDLMKDYIGGIFVGVQTRGGLVTWLPDCGFLLHCSDLNQSNFVIAAVRGNALFVKSSLRPGRVLLHETSKPAGLVRDREWVNSIVTDLKDSPFPLWILLNREAQETNLIFRPTDGLPSIFINPVAGMGGFMVQVSTDLQDAILRNSRLRPSVGWSLGVLTG